jgi:hypothetical protein
MAITGTSLTTGFSDTDATSWLTASITPGANRLILAAVATQRTASATAAVTITGCGLSWVSVATTTYNTIATPRGRVTLLRAMGASPTTGQLTIATGATSHDCALWDIAEFDGVDTGGTDGSAAVVQTDTNRGTGGGFGAVLGALLAFGDAANGTYAFGAMDQNLSGTPSAGSGYTALGNTTNVSAPIFFLLTQWRPDNDLAPLITANPASSCDWAIIAIEIAAGGLADIPRTPLVGSADFASVARSVVLGTILIPLTA